MDFSDIIRGRGNRGDSDNKFIIAVIDKAKIARLKLLVSRTRKADVLTIKHTHSDLSLLQIAALTGNVPAGTYACPLCLTLDSIVDPMCD